MLTEVMEPLFDSNGTWLRWEMGVVRRRAEIMAEARGQGEQGLEALRACSRSARRARAAGLERRRALWEAGHRLVAHGWSAAHDLSPFEEEVLLVCLAMHLDQRTRSRLLHAQGQQGRSDLEVGFLMDLLAPAEAEALSIFERGGALARAGLVKVDWGQVAARGVLGCGISAPHCVAALACGRATVDARLAAFASLSTPQVEPYHVVLSPQARAQVEGLVRALKEGSDAGQAVLITGPSRCGKSLLSESLAKICGRPLLRVELGHAAAREIDADLVRLMVDNARLLGAALHVVEPERLGVIEPGLPGALQAALEGHPGLVVFESRERGALDRALADRVSFALSLQAPEVGERLQLWETLLPQEVELEADVDLQALASAYRLTGGQIQGALAWAQVRLGAGRRLGQAALLEGAGAQLHTHIEDFAEASAVELRLADLVLPEVAMEGVREFLDACRCRHEVMGRWGLGGRLVTGKGLVALFVGEPGTGKTLCAEIVAAELDRQLHIVSIPKIVSKWVGETEKNLREIFNQARAQGSILLFDEADALFGRRVKVERSQDHFQNLEVNMLLQEIERFEGVIILTTNLDSNMDPAFARRILFRLDFPMPDAGQRAEIWRRLLPPRAPIEGVGVDFAALGEGYALTGGQIKNALVRASYRCCAQGKGLSTRALEQAALQQIRSAGGLARDPQLRS